MAETPVVKTRRISRDMLATFLKSHELIKAFEDLMGDVSQALPEAIASSSTDADSLVGVQAFTPRVPASAPSFNDESDKIHSMAAYLPRVPAAIPANDSDSGKVLAMGRFIPTPQLIQQQTADDSSRVIGMQIFGA